MSRPPDSLRIVVIKVSGPRADLNASEPGITNIFQTVENARLPETAGGKPYRPIAHNCLL
jgi:hypothetical protein